MTEYPCGIQFVGNKSSIWKVKFCHHKSKRREEKKEYQVQSILTHSQLIVVVEGNFTVFVLLSGQLSVFGENVTAKTVQLAAWFPVIPSFQDLMENFREMSPSGMAQSMHNSN